MVFSQKIFNAKKRKKQAALDQWNQISADIATATQALDLLLLDTHRYIDPYQVAQWQEQWSDLNNRVLASKRDTKKKTPLEEETLKKLESYKEMLLGLAEKVKTRNERYLAYQMDTLQKMIGPIEGQTLDEQQLTCLLKEIRNQLVVAGAGTGKTMTVIGNIKYLLKTEKYKPGEILVLSYSNASAAEMSSRIRKETGERIDAMTFEKLGSTIITAVNGVKPAITPISLSAFIQKFLNDRMTDPIYLKKFIHYLSFHRISQKSEFEFTSQAEYDDYLELNQPITLKKEIVKSYGEMDIANFLYKNGINYHYQCPYTIESATDEYARYLPDFYLPDADIYIEYVGIDRQGRVPDYFTAKPHQTPTETYQAAIDWKRALHAENQTTMLECYAYEKLEGQLCQSLEKKLRAENVAFNPKSDFEMWDEIKNTNKNILASLGRLFETVINLVKINAVPFEKCYELNRVTQGLQYQSNLCVLELIEPIFRRYGIQLENNKEIDFNDMINMASNDVAAGKYQHPYRYVIVDDYQDISKARYTLLKNMRSANDFALFCVGDDWQSIEGLAGSDINYILDFKKYWGVSEESKIETTYRFSESLIAVTGEFVMKNPKQLNKMLRPMDESDLNAKITSDPENEFSLGLIEGVSEKSTVLFMAETINEIPENSSVFFIGRYHNDVRIFDKSPFKCHYENASGKTRVEYAKRGDLKIEFLSAHKSKGLQADYVFILNNKEKNDGFPSKIPNNAVVQLLLEDSDHYQYAEERRLFYVALTRTRKKVWLLVQDNNKSVFVQELLAGFGNELMSNRHTCPECGGRLMKKSGSYGDFIGCINFRKGCRYSQSIRTKTV